MNKRIDYTKVGGFPLTQDVLDFMQQSYRGAIAAIAAEYGDLVIVTGVADLGANWGDGWVVIGGELMPFVGGVKAAHIVVQETTDNEVFEDAVSKTVYYTKQAVLAPSGGTPFTSFVRLQTVKELTQKSVQSDVAIRVKKITAVWNMDSTEFFTVPHGLADYRKIISVSARVIQSATINNMYFFDAAAPFTSGNPSGKLAYTDGISTAYPTATELGFMRPAGTFFDNSNFVAAILEVFVTYEL